MKKLMVGNWKMNKTVKDGAEFFETFNKSYTGKLDAWVASQAIHFPLVEELKTKEMKAGLQNCSEHVEGAYTGEISPRALKDMNGHFVLLGHSERRQYFGETSRSLNAKVKTVLKEGLVAIYCVGETLQEREAGQTLSLIEDQLHQGLNDQTGANAENLVIAYEPVWAINNKDNLSIDAHSLHSMVIYIRKILLEKYGENISKNINIVYGGSITDLNAQDILWNGEVQGLLIGRASWEVESLIKIIKNVIVNPKKSLLKVYGNKK